MDINHFKELLTNRLAELDERLHEIEDELDETPAKDDEERATEREDDEVLERLGTTGLAEAKMIREALERIEKDTYGICVKCGEDILPARLETLPHTPLCRLCAAQS